MTDRFAFERAKVAALNEAQAELRIEIAEESGKTLVEIACLFIAVLSIISRGKKIFGKCKELVSLWAIS